MSWGCPSICLCMHALYAGMVAFSNWFAVDFSLICVNLPNTGDFECTATTNTVLRPLYRSTCVSRHLQLRTEDLLVQSSAAHMPLLTLHVM